MMAFVLHSLAAWRLAYMLVHELGPGMIFERLRRKVGAETMNEKGYPECRERSTFGMFCCVFCMSIWTAAIVTRSVRPTKVLAVSAGALVVDKIVQS